MADKKKKILLKNTILLYVLNFSTYFFNFITVPYQTRILGAEIYGKLGFALAFMTYFQLVLDFGFLLSATEDVSKKRDDNVELSKIVTAVNLSKLLIGVILGFVLIFCCLVIPKFQEDVLLFVLYFLFVFINSFLPDFLYRGIEDMKIITYRSVFIKLLFTILIFVFLKDKTQYYLVPLFNRIGSLIAVIAVYLHVTKKLKIKFVKVSLNYVLGVLKKSSKFFYSRIASTVYGSTNTFIMGFLYPVGNTVGLYTTSDKLLTTARNAITPISDSVYPYMIKNKDFKLIKKILLIFMPIIVTGCIIVGIFACPLCEFLFGKEFYSAGIILRYMLPIIAISLPTYLLGFPTLSPLGLSKYANLSVILGAICQAALLFAFYMLGVLDVTTICIATIITEYSILATRIYVIIRRKKFSTF